MMYVILFKILLVYLFLYNTGLDFFFKSVFTVATNQAVIIIPNS